MRYFQYLNFIVLLGLFIANPVFAQDEGSTGTEEIPATESGTGTTPESGPETENTPETNAEAGNTETVAETETPTGGETETTPAGGETETTPPGGETETTSPGGETETTSPGGETETTSPGGETETTSPGGETETTPPNDETETTQPSGEPGETGGDPSGTEGGEVTEEVDETPITFTSTITPMTGVAPLTITLIAQTNPKNLTAEDMEGIKYHWQASSGKETYKSGAFATMTFESPGKYIITFVALQNEKIHYSATHTITVLANLLPIASLKALLPCENNDKHCETPLTVELSAADSTDPNGEIVGYRFTSSREGQIFPDEKTGPGLFLCPNEAYSFCPTGEVTYKENWTTTATPIPAVELKETGIHDITVIVIDDKGGISKEPASVSIVVEKSTKPSAVFDFSLKGEYAPMPIQLDASKSKDYFTFKEEPNGRPRIVQYQWTVTSNGKSIIHETLEKTFEHTLDNPGYYTLTLKVTDNDGQSNTARQNVYVKGAKQPIAVADVNPSSGEIGEEGLVVTLNAEDSYDPDGFDIDKYIWRISDGQTVEGKNPEPIMLQEIGLVEIELEVTDQDGHTAKDFKTVMVLENNEDNQQPKAVATFSKLSGRVPLTVKGDATSSYDPDGDTITYHWSSTAGHDDITEKISTFIFDSEGKHFITLEVTDNVEGNSLRHKIKQLIDVLPPLPAPTISAMPETGINPLTVTLSTAFYQGVKYQWQTDGGQLSMANSHVAMIKFEESGTYTITLFVTDTETDKTQEVSKTITVEEPPPPEPLEAKASVSQTEGFAPLSILLDASASEGEIDDYMWTSSDGQTVYGRRATLTFVEPKTYTITLTLSAKSSVRSTETDTITVTVKEKPVEAPEAAATASPLEGIVPLTVTLNANGSKPHDQISEYEWMSEDGQVASGKLTQMTFDKPGNYIITLRVTTESGLDSTKQVTVVVKEPPPPVARATASPSDGVVPLNVNFQANKSEGDIEDYEWSINGQTLYGRRTSVLFDEPGEYTITLLVTDKYGHEDTDEIKVTVKPKNGVGGDPEGVPPIAVAKASPADGFAPLNVTLDASESTGKITEYTWTTPQGTLYYGKRASLLLRDADSYSITLTIKDENGLTATASTTVNVKKQPEEHEPPVAVANITPTEGTAPLKLALDASESQGKIEEYLWISSSGDIAKGKLTNMWIENQGTHVITLRVIGPNGTHETVTTVLVKSKPVTIIDKPTSPPAPSVNVVNEVATEGEGLTEGKKITLDAGNNPDITEYKWTTSSGDVYYGQKPTMLFKEPGDHKIDLTITDKNGVRTPVPNVATVSVPKPAVPPPVVPPLEKEPEEQLFSNTKKQPVKQVTLSIPEIPDVVEYQWKASTGEVAYGRQPSFLFDTPGERTIDLTVKDKNGQTTTAEKIATVSGPGVVSPPLPPIEAEQVEVSASEDARNLVELDASQLTEEFGDIDDDDITWQAIDKDGKVVAKSTGKKSSLSLPDEEGTYTIKMIVKDKAGGIRTQAVVDTATIEASGGVRIGERDEPVPILNAIISDEIKNINVCPGTTITLDGRNSTGNIETYEWTIKAPSGEVKYLNGPKTEWISPKQAGPYTLILKVFDEKDNPPDEATTTVTVVTGEACEIKACFKTTLLACEKDSDKCLELSNKDNIMADSSPDTLTGNMAENWFLIAEVDASCSNRADVSIINYQWELDGNDIPSSKTMTIPLDKGFGRGEHTISLIVTDDKGNKSLPARQSITVCEVIAKATVEPEEFLYYKEPEKRQPVHLDATPSQLVCGSKILKVPEEFTYKWSLESDSSNKESCEKLKCYPDKPNAKNTTIDMCNDIVLEDTDSCTYIPILQLKGPNDVIDKTSLADTGKVTVTWPAIFPIPSITIIKPKIVKPPYREKEKGLAEALAEIETDAIYYGIAPLDMQLIADSVSGVDIEQYDWTVSYYEFYDSSDSDPYPFDNDGRVINLTFEKSGKYTIELKVTDKTGTKSENPASLTIHVGPMLQFVSGDPSSKETPEKLVVSKKLGEALNNLNIKVNFNPALVPDCAQQNDKGEYEKVIDLYAAILIPVDSRRVPLPDEKIPGPEEDVKDDVVKWFSKMTDVEIPYLGLVGTDGESPYIPFRPSIDFNEHIFGLMNVPITDDAWLGTHYFGLGAGLFWKDMRKIKKDDDYDPKKLPVCFDPFTREELVTIKLLEVNVTK